MKKYNLKRFLASLLAVLMLASVTGVSPAVFAEETAAPELVETSKGQPKEVLIKSNFTNEQVLSALAENLLTNAAQVDANDLSWTYTCAVKGAYKNAINQTKYTEAREDTFSVLKSHEYVQKDYTYDVTGSGIFRKEWKADVTYVYPALKDNTDGAYTLYLNGQPVYIKKVAKLKSVINVVDTVPEIAIPYNADGSVNNAKLHESIFKAVVTGTTPEGLTYDNLSYPDNLSEGEQTITISYAGNDDYNGTSKDVTVKFVDGRNVAFESKDKPSTIGVGFHAKQEYDVALTNIREALVNQLGDVPLDKVTVKCRSSINVFGNYEDLSLTGLKALMTTNTALDIKLSYAGDTNHKPYNPDVFKEIKLEDKRPQATIVLKTDASITYNMESDVMKQAILDNVIDWEASDLPAKETLSINDFKFEWKTLPEFTDKLPLDKDKLEKCKAFAPIEGGKGCEVINAAFDCPRMGAGEQVIRVKYVGGSDYKASDYVEGNLTVKKADVKVSIPLIAKIYAGEPLETKENPYATLDPNDPAIDIYKFFVGENSNLQSVAYIDLPASKTKLIDAISDAQVKYLGYTEKDTIKGKLQDGVTIGELKAAMTEIVDYASKDPLTKFFVNAMLKKYGITVDNLKDLVDTLNTITKIADNFKIAIGTPDHAGAYFAFVIAVNDNYNPAYAAGSLIVLKNWKNIKLEKNPVLNSGDKANTITVSQAEELKAGNNLCILTKDGESLNSASAGSIHYWFTGVNKIYAKNVMPTAPGRYIVTATVVGGDFFAFPKTFSFKIVADPTPETTPNA